jgi:protein SCO1/2/putative membrane protein
MNPSPPDSPAPPAVRKASSDARFAALVLALFAAAIAGGFWARNAAKAPLPMPVGNRRLQPFEFTERGGRTVRDTDLRGRMLVVSFVYTGCNLSCRIVSARMAEIQRLTAGHDDVKLVSFTVDPASDTPAVLSEWARKYGADPERWWFLTGEQAAVHGLIGRSFLARDPALRGAMPGEFADADHLAVVDREGRVRAYFDGMRDDAPASVAAMLERLRAEPPKTP